MNGKKMPKIHGVKYQLDGDQVIILFGRAVIVVGMDSFQSIKEMTERQFKNYIKGIVKA